MCNFLQCPFLLLLFIQYRLNGNLPKLALNLFLTEITIIFIIDFKKNCNHCNY